jgi:hypothetical protein
MDFNQITRAENLQLTCAVVLTICFILLFACFVFFVLSSFSIGLFQPSSPDLGFPWPIRFVFLTFLVTCISLGSQASGKFLSSLIGSNANFLMVCTAHFQLSIIGYTLGKIFTIAFLGSRASKMYGLGSSTCKWITPQFIFISTWLFCISFAASLLDAMFDQTIIADPQLLNAGLCQFAFPIVTDIWMNVTDGISSLLLLFFFILPLKEVADLQDGHQHSSRADFSAVVRENLLVGGLTVMFAFVCVSGAAYCSTIPPDEGLTSLPGTLRALDIFANCVMQLYSMRNFFQLKPQWKEYFKGMGLNKTFSTLRIPMLDEDKDSL